MHRVYCAEVKKAAEISMGVEITETDLSHIQELCERVVELTEYRASLSSYLKNRPRARTLSRLFASRGALSSVV